MCIAMDTVCELQQDFEKYVQEIKVEEDIQDKTFSLGVINGKEYLFSEVDGQYAIIILTPKEPALTQVF